MKASCKSRTPASRRRRSLVIGGLFLVLVMVVLFFLNGFVYLATGSPLLGPKRQPPPDSPCVVALKNAASQDPTAIVEYTVVPKDKTGNQSPITLRPQAGEIYTDLRRCSIDSDGEPLKVNGGWLAVLLPARPDAEGAPHNFKLSMGLKPIGSLKRDFNNKWVEAGFQVPDGEQWGLPRYRWTGASAHQLMLFGQLEGNAVYINCMNRDMTKVLVCYLWMQTPNGLFWSMLLHSNEIHNWLYYARLATTYTESISGSLTNERNAG